MHPLDQRLGGHLVHRFEPSFPNLSGGVHDLFVQAVPQGPDQDQTTPGHYGGFRNLSTRRAKERVTVEFSTSPDFRSEKPQTHLHQAMVEVH